MCVCVYVWRPSVLCGVWPRPSNSGSDLPDRSRDRSSAGQLWGGESSRRDPLWLGPLPGPCGVVHGPLGTGNLCLHASSKCSIRTQHELASFCVQCSTECGNGTQTRSVACVSNSNGRLEVVDALRCSRQPRPVAVQPCRPKACGVQWFVTEWSAVSSLQPTFICLSLEMSGLTKPQPDSCFSYLDFTGFPQMIRAKFSPFVANCAWKLQMIRMIWHLLLEFTPPTKNLKENVIFSCRDVLVKSVPVSLCCVPLVFALLRRWLPHPWGTLPHRQCCSKQPLWPRFDPRQQRRMQQTALLGWDE